MIVVAIDLFPLYATALRLLRAMATYWLMRDGVPTAYVFGHLGRRHHCSSYSHTMLTAGQPALYWSTTVWLTERLNWAGWDLLGHGGLCVCMAGHTTVSQYPLNIGTNLQAGKCERDGFLWGLPDEKFLWRCVMDNGDRSLTKSVRLGMRATWACVGRGAPQEWARYGFVLSYYRAAVAATMSTACLVMPAGDRAAAVAAAWRAIVLPRAFIAD